MDDQTKTVPAPQPQLPIATCCAPTVQASCCEPAEKAECCGDERNPARCGCR